MKVIVGITGASGSIYAVSLIKYLEAMNVEIHGIISEMGKKVLDYECAMEKEQISHSVIWHDNNNLFAPIASGSYRFDSMAIVPCSMNTLADIASGSSGTLLTRSAAVSLKEKRRLVIVPREMPLGVIHLEKMLTVAQAGAVILPASPGFYHDPRSLGDLVAHVTGKIIDMLGVENELYKRWGGDANSI